MNISILARPVWYIIVFLLLFFVCAQLSFAAYSIRVTGLEDGQKFTWENDFKSPCSGDNSYVYTYPGRDHQARLHVCEDGYGIASETIPDGMYYIMIAIGGYPFTSQIFEIRNGQLITDPASPTPTPTPTPENNAPIAIAGTSIDSQNNLQLDARNSYDPDGNELTYVWRIEEKGVELTGRTVSLTNLLPATYTVHLWVSDGNKQSTDTLLFGLPSMKQKPSIPTSIKSFSLDKKDGTFTIKGAFDRHHQELQNVIQNPIAKVLIELQTGGTAQNPSFSFIGEALQIASVKR